MDKSKTQSRRHDEHEWHPLKRFGFLFILAYSLLYWIPYPFSAIPWISKVTSPWNDMWKKIVIWTGHALFKIDITVMPNGSGDTTFNYVNIFVFAIVALVIALASFVADRKRPHDKVIYPWLHTYLRIILAATMFSYGLAKIFVTQFDMPLSGLVSTYGNSSPMGLLWKFMGSSPAYSIFTGSLEVLGGLLLLPRRTTLLGALLSAGVMANVVMLNLCYDVPVKQFSMHLLAMAIFLIVPHFKELFDFFVSHKAVAAKKEFRFFQKARHNTILLWTINVFTVVVLGFTLADNYQSAKEYGPWGPRFSLYGIWNVESFEQNGKPIPPLLTDQTRWRRLIIAAPEYVTVQKINDEKEIFDSVFDEKSGKLNLLPYPVDPKTPKSELSFSRSTPDKMHIEGVHKGSPVRINLVRQNEKDFLLFSRGFHWINEYPLNR